MHVCVVRADGVALLLGAFVVPVTASASAFRKRSLQVLSWFMQFSSTESLFSALLTLSVAAQCVLVHNKDSRVVANRCLCYVQLETALSPGCVLVTW